MAETDTIPDAMSNRLFEAALVCPKLRASEFLYFVLFRLALAGRLNCLKDD